MDLAIQLYITSKGYAPTLQDQCGQDQALYGHINSTNNDACVAVSSATTGNGGLYWSKLQQDLAPYMAKLPADPCGTNCSGLGYTYVSPAAIYHECTDSPSICSASKVTAMSYQIYAPLQGVSTPTGYSVIGGFYNPAAPITGSM